AKIERGIAAAASGASKVEQPGRYDARNPGALKRLVAGGAQLRGVSLPIMEGGLEASTEAHRETSATNPHYTKVWGSIESFRNDGYLWWQVAEYGYDSFMIRSRSKA